MPEGKSKEKKSSQIFLKLGLVLISVIFSLVLLEILLANFYPQDTFKKLFRDANRCWQSDEYYWIKFKANCQYVLKTDDFSHDVNINAQGFRGKEVSVPKGENIFRIVFTGDSFVFGNGLGDDGTIPALVEKILNEKKVFGDKKVEVVNAGFLGGGSPDGHLVYLRHKQIDADMYLMGFFIYNDITSDMDSNDWIGVDTPNTPTAVRSKKFEVTDDGLYLNRETDERGLYAHKILRDFNTFIFLGENIKPLFEKAKGKLMKPVIVENSLANEGSDSELLGVHSENCVFGNSECHRRISHLFEDLGNIFFAASAEAPVRNFGVVIIPADFQVYEQAAGKYKSDSWGINGAFGEADPQPQSRVKTMLDKSDIEYIDLLPALRANKDIQTYYPRDAHFNPEGAEIVAESIAKWIEGQYAAGKINL